MSTFRNFLLTLNNPTEDGEGYLRRLHTELHAVYTCGQLERGANGTLHIQAFINFSQGTRPSKIKKLDNRLHIEGVKINNGAHNYCMKEDTRTEGPWEFGTKPVQRNNKIDWQEQFDLAKTGQLDKVNPELLIKHYGNLKRIEADFKEIQVPPLPMSFTLPNGEEFIYNDEVKKRHLWLWSSEPNKGKTTFIRSLEEYGVLWFNYQEGFQEVCKGQQVVALDEFQSAQITYSKLNQICDGTFQYPRKGLPAIRLQPLVIVCGNKDPANIYKELALIEARFNVI